MAPSSADRRRAPGLVLAHDRSSLTLGSHTVALWPHAGNREVLNAYVELTARNRGDRVGNVVQVRHEDVEALADALDLDAADLGEEIERILGATRAEAQQTVLRLKESRTIGGIARAATSHRA